MDPFTHGVAGALIAKAFFADSAKESPAAAPQTVTDPASALVRQRIVVLTLGALFPDIDVVFKLFSSSPVGTLEYHRWITHSLLCLPFFALALAAATRAFFSWREARRDRAARADDLRSGRTAGAHLSMAHLTLLYGVGILSHIFLDAITSWGTMVWAPLRDSRIQWDWVFIIDGTFTALILAPQLLAWIYREPSRTAPRRLGVWFALSSAAILLQQVSTLAGVLFSYAGLSVVLLVIAMALFTPEWKGWGARITRMQWARAGVMITAVYLLVCFAAQRIALDRVQEFARRESLQAQRVGALPLPPFFTRWAGLIRTSAGVYQTSFSLLDSQQPQFEFVADRATPESLEAATTLRAVQTYLWFARFPVVETREVSGQQVVVFTDHRFVQRWASAPVPFEYWVVLDVRGNVVRQGWAQDIAAGRR